MNCQGHEKRDQTKALPHSKIFTGWDTKLVNTEDLTITQILPLYYSFQQTHFISRKATYITEIFKTFWFLGSFQKRPDFFLDYLIFCHQSCWGEAA